MSPAPYQPIFSLMLFLGVVTLSLGAWGGILMFAPGIAHDAYSELTTLWAIYHG